MLVAAIAVARNAKTPDADSPTMLSTQIEDILPLSLMLAEDHLLALVSDALRPQTKESDHANGATRESTSRSVYQHWVSCECGTSSVYVRKARGKARDLRDEVEAS